MNQHIISFENLIFKTAAIFLLANVWLYLWYKTSVIPATGYIYALFVAVFFLASPIAVALIRAKWRLFEIIACMGAMYIFVMALSLSVWRDSI